MTTIYLAGPLFSLAEREFNRRLADAIVELKPNVQIVLPQDQADWLSSGHNSAILVFQDCIHHIDRSHLVLAILDGADADSGTCIELGYAYARGIPIIGIRTDPRALQDRGLNLMVSQICKTLIIGERESYQTLASIVVRHIGDLVASNSTK